MKKNVTIEVDEEQSQETTSRVQVIELTTESEDRSLCPACEQPKCDDLCNQSRPVIIPQEKIDPLNRLQVQKTMGVEEPALKTSSTQREGKKKADPGYIKQLTHDPRPNKLHEEDGPTEVTQMMAKTSSIMTDEMSSATRLNESSKDRDMDAYSEQTAATRLVVDQQDKVIHKEVPQEDPDTASVKAKPVKVHTPITEEKPSSPPSQHHQDQGMPSSPPNSWITDLLNQIYYYIMLLLSMFYLVPVPLTDANRNQLLGKQKAV